MFAHKKDKGGNTMFSWLKKKKQNPTPYIYSEKDMSAFDAYVKKHIGEFDEVFHELVSPDIHVDVVPIPNPKDKSGITLVTMGMGAYPMNVPSNYKEKGYTRAELAMKLPDGWDIGSNEEASYWPIRVLKMLARLPISEQSWLGYRHTIDFGGPFSENCGFTSVTLDFFLQGDEPLLTLSSGEKVLIYHVVPLYPEEMQFKIDHSAEALFALLGDKVLQSAVDMNRPNVVKTN